MIRAFRHRGLRERNEQGRSSKTPPSHKAKLLRILTALDASTNPQGMDLTGFRLHSLKGPLRGHHAVPVSANRRVASRIEGADAFDGDYLDCHCEASPWP